VLATAPFGQGAREIDQLRADAGRLLALESHRNQEVLDVGGGGDVLGIGQAHGLGISLGLGGDLWEGFAEYGCGLLAQQFHFAGRVEQFPAVGENLLDGEGPGGHADQLVEAGLGEGVALLHAF
jgi:hypothetical protein